MTLALISQEIDNSELIEASIVGLTELFHHHYARRKARIRSRLIEGEQPTIIRAGPELIFLYERQRHSEVVTSEAYDRLNRCCHLPLALYLRLAELVDIPLSPRDVRDLSTLADAVEELSGDEEDDTRRSILSTVRAALSSAIDHRHVTHQELARLAAKPRDAIAACILEAARLELGAVHAAVLSWTADFDSSDWDRLHVVVCANHQARYKQSTKMYFLRRLKESAGVGAESERRLLYAENVGTVEEALDLLAVHLLDAELGAAFEGSPLALQEDVLGDAAQTVIDELLG